MRVAAAKQPLKNTRHKTRNPFKVKWLRGSRVSFGFIFRLLGKLIVFANRNVAHLHTVPVVMRTYAHLYPNKQQELVSRLETLSTSSSSKDESDLMPLGQGQNRWCQGLFFDVMMSQKPQKVSISRCFLGLSNYSSIINRATSSLYIQQVFLKRMMSKWCHFYKIHRF